MFGLILPCIVRSPDIRVYMNPSANIRLVPPRCTLDCAVSARLFRAAGAGACLIRTLRVFQRGAERSRLTVSNSGVPEFKWYLPLFEVRQEISFTAR